MDRNIATLLVEQFESYGIEYVFCVPGASIDAILTALKGRKPQLILCRQESSAGHMAIAYAKKSGKPSVVMVTAGPGATNVVTAAATATLEHAPLIIITGQMDSKTLFKPSHQVINAESLFVPVCKLSLNVNNPNTLSGIWDYAYQIATTGATGAIHLALSSDLLATRTNLVASKPLPNLAKPYAMPETITLASNIISSAKCPLIIIGADAATTAVAWAIEQLIAKTSIPVICSFEGGGLIKDWQMQHFMGRIGSFQNQPCNEIIAAADLMISIGYNIAELDPLYWNKDNSKRIIHISEYLPVVADGYRPELQLLGDIARNINNLTAEINYKVSQASIQLQDKIYQKLVTRKIDYTTKANLVHPLYVIKCLQEIITPDDSLVSDVGSHQYWVSEYFVSNTPRQYINSMGFQTLGVSLAFAIGAAFSSRKGRVYSVSGDGGVLMCIMELATAVEHNIPLIHLIWKDHSYDLVAIQEEHKYNTTSGVQFTQNIDFVKMAESFGAVGLRVMNEGELMPALLQAQKSTKPVIIDIAIDYSDNLKKLVE